MRIGVVVPALVRDAEEADNLRRCLEAIGRCDPAPDRLVVVDDGSPGPIRQEGDRIGVAALGRLAGRAEVIRQANQGPAAARNAGARRLCDPGAAGDPGAADPDTSDPGGPVDVLVFIDADIIVAPDAIARMRAGLAAGAAAIWGTVTEAHPHPEATSHYKNLCHRHFTLLQRGRTRHLTSMLVAVRREAFEAAGGFDARLRTVSVEDVELGRTISDQGGQVILDTDLEAEHRHRFTLRRILKNDFHKARHHARTTLQHRLDGDDSTRLDGPGERRQLRYLLGVPVGAAALGCLLSGRWAAGAALTGAMLAMERDLFGYLWRCRGARFAVGCVPLMLIERGVVLAAVTAGAADGLRERAGLTRKDQPG